MGLRRKFCLISCPFTKNKVVCHKRREGPPTPAQARPPRARGAATPTDWYRPSLIRFDHRTRKPNRARSETHRITTFAWPESSSFTLNSLSPINVCLKKKKKNKIHEQLLAAISFAFANLVLYYLGFHYYDGRSTAHTYDMMVVIFFTSHLPDSFFMNANLITR